MVNAHAERSMNKEPTEGGEDKRCPTNRTCGGGLARACHTDEGEEDHAEAKPEGDEGKYSRTGSLQEASVTEPETPRGKDEDPATEDTVKLDAKDNTQVGKNGQTKGEGKGQKEKKSGGKVAEMIRKIEALGKGKSGSSGGEKIKEMEKRRPHRRQWPGVQCKGVGQAS